MELKKVSNDPEKMGGREKERGEGGEGKRRGGGGWAEDDQWIEG